MHDNAMISLAIPLGHLASQPHSKINQSSAIITLLQNLSLQANSTDPLYTKVLEVKHTEKKIISREYSHFIGATTWLL